MPGRRTNGVLGNIERDIENNLPKIQLHAEHLDSEKEIYPDRSSY